MKRGLAWLLVGVLFLVSLAACAKREQPAAGGDGNTQAPAQQDNQDSGQPAGGEEPAGEKVLTFALTREGNTLDHIKGSWTFDAHTLVFDSLVTRDYDLNYKPGLAESWESSPDGMTWTFHLRKGVRFHDGTPFNSAAVKWFFETLIDPEVNSPSQADYVFIDHVETPDEYTAVFHLKHSYPNILFKISNSYSGIISPTAYQKYGPEGTNKYGTSVMVGTGLYKFVEWIPGDRLVLEKNPEYTWGPDWVENKGPAKVDKIIYRIMPDSATRLMEFQAGNIDILLDVPLENLKTLESDPNVEVFKRLHFGLGYLAMATDKPPLNNLKVRQAINLSINREAIVKAIFRGEGAPAYGYLPPTLSMYLEDKEAHSYDPVKARQLLAEAGLPNGFSATLASLNSSEHKRVAEALQAQLKDVGINVELRVFDNSSYVDYLKAGEQELFVREYSWSAADILQWFLDSNQFPYPNHSRWQDATTDQMIKAAESAPTYEQYEENYRKVQRYLIDNAVWAPAWTPPRMRAVRTDRVEGFRFHPLYTVLYDVDVKS